MRIVAKTDTTYEEIKARKELGFDYAELQLLQKDLPFLKEEGFRRELIRYFRDCHVTPVSVHTPLAATVEPFPEIQLEYISNDRYFSAFKHTCQLADAFGKEFHQKTLVVLHNGMTMRDFEIMPALLDAVSNRLSEILRQYPHIELTIENICPFRVHRECSNGFDDSNRDLAKYFNEVFSTSRFNTTVDFCHYEVTKKIFNEMIDKHAIVDAEKFHDVSEYVRKELDTIANVHVNSMRNYGEDRLTHSQPFNPESREDIEYLKRVLLVLQDVEDREINLTLEVNDSDYIGCPNLLMTREAVLKALHELEEEQAA